MPLARGAMLGPYRVDAEIGVGGMGHVFRATDTRLDRAVALKVLPAHKWTDPELRQRFEREARALSSLSHPNLCPLYDVGEWPQPDGTAVPYLVMELLEGATLRDRMLEGPVPLRRALHWAAQIASGLAAAHQKGVIHRDLKPENVFITRGKASDELLKILDFGLATTTHPPSGSATLLRTEPGMVMGTAHYMSPEQVRGHPLDARSDIFSLGILLFEMLTGRVPFQARSAVETMNAILVEDPPSLASLVAPIPEGVEELVQRCLEKDPVQRFSSARDLAFALESAAKTVTTSTPVPVRRRTSDTQTAPKLTRSRAVVLAIILSAIVIAAALSRGAFDRADPEPPRLHTLTYSGRDSAPAASPDGKLIAYVSTRDGRRRIWLKQLVDGTEAAVTEGPDDSAPRFRPDGSVLLFTRTERDASALYRIAVLGGEPRKLLDNAFDGDWSPDGRQIAFIRSRGASDRLSTLCIAPSTGGPVREIAATPAEELFAPRWSPDGTKLAVSRAQHGTGPGSLLVVDLSSGTKQILARATPHGLVSGAAWTDDSDALLYLELEALAGSGLPRRSGSSVLVKHELSGRSRVLLRNPHSAADTVDIVGPGRIVFSEDMTRQSLQEIALNGSKPPRWLSRGLSVDRQPAYARGGTSIVFASDRSGNVDVWELMLDSGTSRRITDHEGVDWDPHPSADGSLFWSSNREGHFEVWTSSMDGANPRPVTRDGVDAENPSLPARGDWIFYDSSNPKRDALWRMPRAGGAPVLVHAGETIHPVVSPDGLFVAYQRPEEGGASAIDVVRIADGTRFTLASGIGGVSSLRTQWMNGSSTLVFRATAANGSIALFAQDFRPGVDTSATRRQLTPGDPDQPPETFAISPDGTRAVLAIVDEASGLMIAEGVPDVDEP